MGIPEPPEEVKNMVLAVMEEAYKLCVTRIPDDFLSYDSYLRAVSRLDMRSSPGYPVCLQYGTNGSYLGWDGVSHSEYGLKHLWNEVKKIIYEPELDSDIILRVFIKHEPHKREKVEEGRLRLIMASPVALQVVWHMLFDDFNDAEIRNSYFIPSQQGITLHHGSWKDYVRLWKALGYDTGLDKRAWDWTAPGWLLMWNLEFRARMMRGSKLAEWYALAQRMYVNMFEESKIMTSDGQVYQQEYPGIMKSGCVNTISDNSHCQVMGHILACLKQGVPYYPLPACCGDDTLQRLDQAVDVEAYKVFGAIVKSASDGLEFVGMEFTSDGPIPLYTDKHLAKFRSVCDENMSAYLDSMARMYCKNREMFSFWEFVAGRLGVDLYSREYYSSWFDNESWD